ncbi:MAG: hypothetical protein QF749_02725, partial [Verrucomicrobiota bacterium]|nr:hypothetical protein [Verrucomicrobiota bacterium]
MKNTKCCASRVYLLKPSQALGQAPIKRPFFAIFATIWEQKNAAWPSATTMATHPQILQIFAEAQTPSHLRHSTSSADEKNR